MRRLSALARRHRWWVWALWALGLLVLLGGPTGALDPVFWVLAPDPELLALTVLIGVGIARSSVMSYVRCRLGPALDRAAVLKGRRRAR